MESRVHEPRKIRWLPFTAYPPRDRQFRPERLAYCAIEPSGDCFILRMPWPDGSCEVRGVVVEVAAQPRTVAVQPPVHASPLITLSAVYVTLPSGILRQ